MSNQQPTGNPQHNPTTSHAAAPAAGQQPPSSAQPGKKTRNTLALVALIVSIVGFIFACIPGALILGWILLPIAFILALVSLFLKGSGKGLGIAALIVSVVGTIVAFVVFFAVVAASVDEAFGGDDVAVEQPAEAGQAPAAEEPAQDSGATAGTRENPVAIGSTITTDDWTVVVNSYNTDGNAIVAQDQFNDAAPAGSHYEVVNYTVTYTGEESAYAAEVGVDVVTGAGNVVNSYDTIVLLEDSMGVDELFTGASATGSAAFVVPDGETALLRVRPGMMSDEIFVQP